MGVNLGAKPEREVVAPAIDGGDSRMRAVSILEPYQPWGLGGSAQGGGCRDTAGTPWTLMGWTPEGVMEALTAVERHSGGTPRRALKT